MPFLGRSQSSSPVHDDQRRDSGPGLEHAKRLNLQRNKKNTSTKSAQQIKNVDITVPERQPIAICGMAMRLPGGIRDAEGFWDVLVNGKDMRGPIKPSRYNAEGFDDSLGIKGAIHAKHGYFLDEDLGALDASFFSMSGNEVERADPQQRLLLEVVRECFDNAGETNYSDELVGCYVGTFGEDWLNMSAKEQQHSGSMIMTGHGDLMIANRASYEYNLLGPSMVIKTGCSASLIGLHEACRAIQAGDCHSAIVAGTNLIMSPMTTAAMTTEGILSPDGSCKTFDASANGFARAESISALYVKRVDHALRDGNPIRAIIRNTGSNSDGRSSTLMAPSGAAHERLMKKVYTDAGLDPSLTPYVECHGTGTATGDPIETSAVGNVFGDQGTYIGSVKPNIGHSEGASGISSVIKAVLALENKTIPPQIKFQTPNPKIPFEQMNLLVPTESTPFPEGRAERISVNSFGIGGANAHAIIDSAAQYLSAETARRISQPTLEINKPQLLLYSANTQESLKRFMLECHEYNTQHPDLLHDVSYTLAVRRQHLPHRAFGITGAGVDPTVSSMLKVPTKPSELVMVFTGQGAQWPRMGSELFELDDEFRRDIRNMDQILKTLTHPPEWSLQNELLAAADSSRIHDAELSQPLCTALQIALVNKLYRAGCSPDVVVGHSSGEIGAAYAAGSLDMTAALICAYYRGFVTKQQTLDGGMAAIGMGVKETEPLLEPGVIIACENSPSSVTISGDKDVLNRVISRVKREYPDCVARPLKVNMAYHSHHMVELGKRYVKLVQDELARHGCAVQDPIATFYSSVHETIIERGQDLKAEYWEANLVSPVLFNSAVSQILADRTNSLFVEVGPHGALAGPLRQICAAAGKDCQYISTLARGQHGYQSLLNTTGLLYQQGIDLDLDQLVGDGIVLTDLPRYAWDHQNSYWHESRISSSWRFRKHGHHALLGLRVTETPDTQPVWRNVLNLDDQPWLQDHKIRKDIVFPFAGYVSMAGEAVRQTSGIETGYSIRNAVAKRGLILEPNKSVELVTSLYPHSSIDAAAPEIWDFSIASYTGSAWVVHFTGEVRALEGEARPSNTLPQLPRVVPKRRFYEDIADVGIVYGPEFQGLNDITSATTATSAVAKVLCPAQDKSNTFLFHPAALDACFQLLLVAMSKGLGRNCGDLQVPTKIAELDIRRGAGEMEAHAFFTTGEASGIECNAHGEQAVRLTGLELTPLDAADDAQGDNDKHAAARLHWRPHFDFSEHHDLFTPPPTSNEEIRLMEEMTLLCSLDSLERLQNLEPVEPHWAKFRAWLGEIQKQAASGTYPLVENSKEYLSFTREQRTQMVDEVEGRLKLVAHNPAIVEGIRRIWTNVEDIFTGKRDTLDILMEGNCLTEIYNVVSMGHGGFVQSLSSTKPDLRILEVGAGTGGTTQTFLKDLVDDYGYPKYAKYTFTDVSAGFFVQAKERFSYAANMEYKVFDISQSPFEQGFEAETYDLILAPNVVHATESLNKTLKNLQPLLRRGGRLVLTELCAEARTPNYIFGNFVGWWLGEDDNRYWQPYISVERWHDELLAAGFTGVDTARLDAPKPFTYCAAIVSERCFPDEAQKASMVSLISNGSNSTLVGTVRQTLQDKGYSIQDIAIGDAVPKGQTVLVMVDTERAFFDNISAESWATFQQTIRSISDEKVLWITAPSQLECGRPDHAHAIGVARTIRSELGIALSTLEIDINEPRFADLTLQVLQQIESAREDEMLQPDREYAVQNGVVHVPRYHPFSLAAERESLSHLPSSFRPDVSYLITGGVGGLGKALAVWMAERGATSLVFVSRSAGSKEADIAFGKELASLGCEARFVAGQAEDSKSIEQAISMSRAPIAGVIHLAMVLRDAKVTDMSYEDWKTVNDVKVNGAWRLHEAFSQADSRPLDFFVIASTFNSIVGQPGQGNYNAASTYLEAFTQWRRSQGLPCSILNIGPIQGVGYLAENAKARQNMKANGLYFLGESEFLDYMDLAITQSSVKESVDVSSDRKNGWQSTGQVVMGLRSENSLRDPTTRTNWRRDRRMAIYHNINTEADAGTAKTAESDPLTAFLDRAADDPSILAEDSSSDLLARLIAKKVFAFMLKPEEEADDIDTGLSLTQLGLDSLIAIEVRRWWKQTFKLDISVLEIVGAGTLKELGGKAAAGVMARLTEE